MNIPLYKPYLPEAVGSFSSLPLISGWLSYGPCCEKLESCFTDCFGGWSLALNSCTSALYTAGRILYRSPEDEVIVPAITFVSTGMAFQAAGFRVVPADVTETGLLDPKAVEKAITPNTRAVVPVHLYGQKADTKALREICDSHGLKLIEDCAHRIGLYDKERYGDLCCYSFNTMKELPSGEGGLLWGRDPLWEQQAREFANVGLSENTIQRTSSPNHSDYCFSGRDGLKLLQNDLIASLTLSLLPYYNENMSRRREIFNRYEEVLCSYPVFQVFDRREDDSCLMFVLRMESCLVGEFRDALAAAGIASSHHYPSLSGHPLFSLRADCPEAERLEKEVVTLPCFVELDEERLEHILSTIRIFGEEKEAKSHGASA